VCTENLILFDYGMRLTVDRGWARSAPEIGSQQARDNRRKFRKAASANNTLRFWQLKG
jgi:hypothetical protein